MSFSVSINTSVSFDWSIFVRVRNSGKNHSDNSGRVRAFWSLDESSGKSVWSSSRQETITRKRRPALSPAVAKAHHKDWHVV